MLAKVLFFGATRQIVGVGRTDFEVPDAAKSKVVFDILVARYPGLATHKLHFSVNQQFAKGDETIHDGDELAIFTAVSGG